MPATGLWPARRNVEFVPASVAEKITSPVAAPAIVSRELIKEEDGHLKISGGTGKPDFFVQHWHGIGGVKGLEMQAACAAATRKLGHDVTVIMPLSEKLAHQPCWDNVGKRRTTFDLARYALGLPKDIQLDTFADDTTGLWQKMWSVGTTMWSGMPMWYPIVFKLVAEASGEAMVDVISCWEKAGTLNFGQLVREICLPPMVPDKVETIPHMLKAVRFVKDETDEYLRREGVNGNLIVTTYSQGSGMGVPMVLLPGAEHPDMKDLKVDPALDPGLLVVANAPLVLDHGMPKIPRHRKHVPIHVVMPRADKVQWVVMKTSADEVRRQAAKQNLPVRVHEPPGDHDYPCRLISAILKRHFNQWAGPVPAYV